MTSRELVIKTLNHEPVPRVARDLWLPAGEEAVGSDFVAELSVRYPSDIVQAEVAAAGKKSAGKASKSGDFTDPWGCVWHSGEPGKPPELKVSPLAETEKIAGYQPPGELLEKARFAKVNKGCAATSRFVLGWSEARPFDRLRFLRGEAALVDLARGTKDIRGLLAMLHDFACKELEVWADTDVDGVALRDDLGTAEGLLVGAEMWRELFRPLYREYCKILHAKDKFVFFHGDGNLFDILGDLIKTGIDAVHVQLGLTDVERLAKRFRGRVTFWGGMDCRRLQEPGSTEQLREAALAIRKALDFGSGGVIAQCQWEPGASLTTVATFFEQWLVPLPMRAC
jgi:uroporphyrinogen decarboxylase